MAAMVRDGEVSPVELVEDHLLQIERENPRINAFVTVFGEEARAAARRAEAAVSRGDLLGMLHGIPVSVKDCFDIEGYPTLCGSRLRLGHRAAHDATAVARLRAEGAIILGKTNCPEFLGSYETDNYVTGRTNNPADPERTPGGSSGGEAAAIAAYCSAGGLGSDGGGSIRMPAHFTGIAGLKPTTGRISGTGHFPAIGHPWGMVTAAGPMARSVADLKLLFAALTDYDSRDPFSAPVPLRVPARSRPRIGIFGQFYDVPVQPLVAAAITRAARVLQTIGFPLEAFTPTGLERAPNLWWFFFGQLPAPFTRQLVQGHEDEVHWTATEALNRALQDPPPTAEQLVHNFAARDAMRAALLRQMEDVPVLLTPPCGITAFRHRERRWPAGEKSIGMFQAMMPSVIWNVLGFPAVAVPMGTTPEGLPVGVQLVARPWEDELLLEVAAELEEARDL
jgi:Asp-tRNA(Asn)/Glu-tRNA(Gln) amidotransferase A subunit family amidase